MNKSLSLPLLKFMAAIMLSASPSLSAQASEQVSSPAGIPFRYTAGHILVIPVIVCGKKSEFVLDTGCGVNVISDKLAQQFTMTELKPHKGRRMSGQELTVKMARLPSLKISTSEKKDIATGIWNFKELLGDAPEFAGIEGFVSLNYFETVPFTLDYKHSRLYIENEESLKQRAKEGSCAPIRVNRNGNADTSITLAMKIGTKLKALCEVDTGSGSLILNESYMGALGIQKDAKGVSTREGKDETGHQYVRYFSTLDTTISPSKAPQASQAKPGVQFQKIIYDGLVGDSFLHNFVVTYDLPHKRMIFAKSSPD